MERFGRRVVGLRGLRLCRSQGLMSVADVFIWVFCVEDNIILQCTMIYHILI